MYYTETRQTNCPVCNSVVTIYKVYTTQQKWRDVKGVCIKCMDKELAAIRGKNKKQKEDKNGIQSIREKQKQTRRGAKTPGRGS